MAPAGNISRTIMRAVALIAGVRMGLPDFRMTSCAFCIAVALWNGADAIFKERLFGLTGAEGNHGEDVKELYYLDWPPTQSYMKALYKYPQAAFPYRSFSPSTRRAD